MADEDTLYNLRNNFYIGNYQAAINEADSIPDSELKSLYVYRSYIGLGNYELVQEEINDDSSPELQAVRCLADYLQSREQVDEVFQKLAALSGSEMSAVVSAIIFYYENRVDDGLRAIAGVNSMEAKALMIHGLMMLNRLDKAEEVYKQMQAADED